MPSVELAFFHVDYGCVVKCTVGNRWQDSWNVALFPATFYVDYQCYLSVSQICGGNKLG
jgi:hypothetical protein